MTTLDTENQALDPIEMMAEADIQPEYQSMLKELLAVIIFAVFGTALMIHLNAVEKLLSFSRAYEK